MHKESYRRRGEKKNKAKTIFEEIRSEKSQNLFKDINLHIEEAQ